MTAYALPSDWTIGRFEMQVAPNTRRFSSPYAPASEQNLDLFGDYWIAALTVNAGRALPAGAGALRGGAIQALIDLLAGGGNVLTLHNLRRARPLGTLGSNPTGTTSVVNASLAAVNVVNASLAAVTVQGGGPTLAARIAQYTRTGVIQTHPGETAFAGDHVGMANGQTVRLMRDTVADASGAMPIVFAPCARSDIAAASVVTVDAPTVDFRLKRGTRPSVVWAPGMYEAVTFDLVEAA